MKTRADWASLALAGGFAATMMLLAAEAVAENSAMPAIDLPNPYRPG